jgi:hypothetical protein
MQPAAATAAAKALELFLTLISLVGEWPPAPHHLLLQF